MHENIHAGPEINVILDGRSGRAVGLADARRFAPGRTFSALHDVQFLEYGLHPLRDGSAARSRGQQFTQQVIRAQQQIGEFSGYENPA